MTTKTIDCKVAVSSMNMVCFINNRPIACGNLQTLGLADFSTGPGIPLEAPTGEFWVRVEVDLNTMLLSSNFHARLLGVALEKNEEIDIPTCFMQEFSLASFSANK